MHETVMINSREECAVCRSKALRSTIAFPQLPLTDTYTWSEVAESIPALDLDLWLCEKCGHAQLLHQVDPTLLYGEEYHFRTGASAIARSGTAFHLNFLDMVAPEHHRHILDVGCNDLYLLGCMDGRADIRTGIDPLLPQGKGEQNGIQTIGGTVENVNLRDLLVSPPDLVLCRHTLEHIWDPRSVLETLLDATTDDAVFIVEVPAFDVLLNRFRIDQIFHQHLQYFSLQSLCHMLQEMGVSYMAHAYNYHDWGAVAIAFTKRKSSDSDFPQNFPFPFDEETIERVHMAFRSQMAASRSTLDELKGVIYGYGAAQMLPVLAYHLETDLSQLAAVLDDDSEKDGLRYTNLPVNIRRADSVQNLEESVVLITAVDNIQPIMQRLFTRRPRRILSPLNII